MKEALGFEPSASIVGVRHLDDCAEDEDLAVCNSAIR